MGQFAECTPRRNLYGNMWVPLDRGSGILHSQMSATWLFPAHIVVIDRNRREVVVAVWGTQSLEDVTTDLGMEVVPLCRRLCSLWHAFWRKKTLEAGGACA